MKRYSILGEDSLKRCFFCPRKAENTHEVFHGRNRQRSIKHGFCVGLCFRCHRALHDGKMWTEEDTMDKYLKKVYQEEYERSHTREEFLKIIDMNYLDN